MPRTVVPPVRLRGSESAGLGGGDGLPEKLAKYVPAETLAFFVPLSASLGDSRPVLLWAVIVVGLLGTIGWLWLAAQKVTSDEKPRIHFFVLSGVSFLAWTLGSSASVSKLIGIDSVAAGVILGIAVFIIPLSDGVLNKVVNH